MSKSKNGWCLIQKCPKSLCFARLTFAFLKVNYVINIAPKDSYRNKEISKLASCRETAPQNKGKIYIIYSRYLDHKAFFWEKYLKSQQKPCKHQ